MLRISYEPLSGCVVIQKYSVQNIYTILFYSFLRISTLRDRASWRTQRNLNFKPGGTFSDCGTIILTSCSHVSRYEVVWGKSCLHP